jgi:hypothetical protein
VNAKPLETQRGFAAPSSEGAMDDDKFFILEVGIWGIDICLDPYLFRYI